MLRLLAHTSVHVFGDHANASRGQWLTQATPHGFAESLRFAQQVFLIKLHQGEQLGLFSRVEGSGLLFIEQLAEPSILPDLWAADLTPPVFHPDFINKSLDTTYIGVGGGR